MREVIAADDKAMNIAGNNMTLYEGLETDVPIKTAAQK